MNNKYIQVKSFFNGQYFANGLKITLGIVLPSLVLSGLGYLQMGLYMSMGAMYVSITDHPGPIKHRRNGMLFANGFMFLTALTTAYLHDRPWLLAIEIPVLYFIFGMFTSYGARASAVGTAALLMMIASMHSKEISPITYTALSLSGGLWYMALSLSLSQIRPYRLAQQMLGESILEVATYLRIRAKFYDNKTPIEDVYKQLVVQQITINKHQDDVRQILFITRKRVRETMRSGRLVIMIFIDIIDLFEQVMSTHINYSNIRQKYAQNNVLTAIKNIILDMAQAVDNLGYALINNEKPGPLPNLESNLQIIKQQIDELEAQKGSTLVLKKTLINVRNIYQLLNHTYNYFHTGQVPYLSKKEEADLTQFVSHQQVDWRIFKNNLSLNSGIFRHSLRLGISALAGYLIAMILPYNEHSYWILISILVILKPDFSLTKERNYGRVIGTIGGGLLGALVLLLVKDETARLIIMIIFMVTAFSFNRTRYIISVFFVTALILILFSFIYQNSDLAVTFERILYTLIGSGIAFTASYFIFPNWEYSHIKIHMEAILRANLNYFLKIVSRFGDSPASITASKLARKNVYVQTANLGAAFQRMLNEPKSKQENISYLNEFVVMNHMLSSYLASLSSALSEVDASKQANQEHIKSARRAKFLLQEAILHINDDPGDMSFEFPRIDDNKVAKESTDTDFIQRQLRLIKKVSADIEKLTKQLDAIPH